MFLFLLDPFPDAAKTLCCPDEGNGKEIAVEPLAHLPGHWRNPEVFTFKTHYWAHKQVLSQHLCHPCSNAQSFTPGQCPTILQSTILPPPIQLNFFIEVTVPYTQEEC